MDDDPELVAVDEPEPVLPRENATLWWLVLVALMIGGVLLAELRL